ncbi:DUF2339 domain-containing protein [Psychrobacillus vulpis]|uniref:DUF2339 domain-containing protein n=1 Tax=Psychrobacillus vulpis TaxID=2325572 RepID=A0A544TW04_9BACI|nr:DUF2339 domain-containing protein [Psychrobacillus vulpis]TQR21627.1 DUF2339 domain-containing protein [Psychrobacillus vulpis]
MAENQSLEKRVEYLEKRVRFLEEALQVKASIVPSQETIIHNKQHDKKSIEWDVLIFQKILPPLFIIVFIVGIVWAFKAVSDYGILNEQVKVVLGYVVAGALIGLGAWQIKQSRNVLGQMLLGGAIPILMLTTFAMHQLYNITGPVLSFVLNVIWISLGLFLTYKYKSQGIGIVSTVGGVFVPFLIKSTFTNIPVFSFYEAILFTLFLWIALRYKYKILFYVSVAFLQIALLVFFIFTNVPEGLKWIAVLPIFVQHSVLLICFLKTKHMLKDQAYMLFSIMLFTTMWIRIILTENEASITVAVIALVYGICLYMYQKDLIRTPIFIANGTIALLNFMQLLIDNLLIEGIIGLSVIYFLVYRKFNHILHSILSGITYIIAVFYVFFQPINNWISWGMLHWIIFIIATSYGIYLLATMDKQQKHIVLNIGVTYVGGLLLYFFHMIAVLFSGEIGSNMERVFTSTLWITVSILLMLLSRRFSLQQGKYVGVGILFFTLAKIILFDISFVSVAVKALLFIVLGVVGLLVSRAYYKK